MSSQPEQDLERLKKACEVLGEHFDTVQVFCTRHEPGEHDGTLTMAWGAGNFYTRYGQIAEWIIKTDESSRIAARKREES